LGREGERQTVNQCRFRVLGFRRRRRRRRRKVIQEEEEEETHSRRY